MGEIILLIILVFVNAFFAASEIAFISLNDAKIDVQAKEGNKKAKKIKLMLQNPSKFLSTIQIGITLAGFLSSAFASEKFADEVAPVLYNIAPSWGIGIWHKIAIILITIILSYFTLIFGELVPKRIAMKNYERIAYGSIGIIKAISVIASPFVKLLTISTNFVSKIFGVNEKEEETVTEEEIRMMVDVGEEKGTIEEEEKAMINNVFEFNDKAVSEIMVPRTEIFAFDIEMTIAEAIEELTEDIRYSRVPVYEESIDNIKGIVYIKDILLSNLKKNDKIKKLIRDAYFVPETKQVNELFEELRKNRKQIAIVVDEYGGTSGIVTMEDILEEIVGEIYDEYDEVEDIYQEIDENTYILSGSMAIYEVDGLLNIEIKDGDYDTLSGYLIDKLDRIPSEKEKKITIDSEEATYIVEKVKDKRIDKVKVIKKEIKEHDKNNERDKEKE